MGTKSKICAYLNQLRCLAKQPDCNRTHPKEKSHMVEGIVHAIWNRRQRDMVPVIQSTKKGHMQVYLQNKSQSIVCKGGHLSRAGCKCTLLSHTHSLSNTIPILESLLSRTRSAFYYVIGGPINTLSIPLEDARVCRSCCVRYRVHMAGSVDLRFWPMPTSMPYRVRK